MIDHINTLLSLRDLSEISRRGGEGRGGGSGNCEWSDGNLLTLPWPSKRIELS